MSDEEQVGYDELQSEHRHGWECPRCKKIHAPWVEECDCEPEGFSAWTEGTATLPQTVWQWGPSEFKQGDR